MNFPVTDKLLGRYDGERLLDFVCRRLDEVFGKDNGISESNAAGLGRAMFIPGSGPTSSGSGDGPTWFVVKGRIKDSSVIQSAIAAWKKDNGFD